jgi:hypothetical protein
MSLCQILDHEVAPAKVEIQESKELKRSESWDRIVAPTPRVVTLASYKISLAKYEKSKISAERIVKIVRDQGGFLAMPFKNAPGAFRKLFHFPGHLFIFTTKLDIAQALIGNRNFEICQVETIGFFYSVE